MTARRGGTEARFDARVREEFASRKADAAALVTAADLAPLPAPVRRYVERSGAVGKPRVRSFRAVFAATMYRKPGRPMPMRAVQVEWVDRPVRLFFMSGRMFGLPVRVLHEYAGERAHMRVRVAGLLDVVNDSGAVLDRAETVTVMNDLCILAPSALVDPRFGFEPVDDRTVRAAFRNGEQRVTATLYFDGEGDLVDFSSDDRGGRPGDGDRWTTPVRDYRWFDGRRVAAVGETIWHWPDRSFKYGEFVLASIAYDPAGPAGPDRE